MTRRLLRPVGGGKPSWLSADELDALHARATSHKGQMIEIEADELARLVVSNIRAEDGFSNIRALCRREIMEIKTKHLEEIAALRRQMDGETE